MSNVEWGYMPPILSCPRSRSRSSFRRWRRALSRGSATPRVAYGLLLVAAAAGCTPEIGDKCVLSTDCSIRGDRLCDTSQPGGYCTVFNCQGDSCPDKAACVLFNAAVQGCGFDDRSGPTGSRTARSFCVARCYSNSDCRGDYICADPRRPPWGALILDDDQTQLTCLVRPTGWDDDGGVEAGKVSTAPVCGPAAPEPPAISATPPTIDRDSGVPPLFPDASADAGDAGADAADAGDGG